MMTRPHYTDAGRPACTASDGVSPTSKGGLVPDHPPPSKSATDIMFANAYNLTYFVSV